MHAPNMSMQSRPSARIPKKNSANCESILLFGAVVFDNSRPQQGPMSACLDMTCIEGFKSSKPQCSGTTHHALHFMFVMDIQFISCLLASLSFPSVSMHPYVPARHSKNCKKAKQELKLCFCMSALASRALP